MTSLIAIGIGLCIEFTPIGSSKHDGGYQRLKMIRPIEPLVKRIPYIGPFIFRTVAILIVLLKVF